ncbi:hypothetical protein GCM10022253_02420 [Sphingomonas endophytica]
MRTSLLYPVLAGTLTVFALHLLHAAQLAGRPDLHLLLIGGSYGYLLSRLGPLLRAVAVRRRRWMLKAPVLPPSTAPFGDTSGKVVSIRDARRETAATQAVPYGPWAQNVLPMVLPREARSRVR